jgi:hypothetical protein
MLKGIVIGFLGGVIILVGGTYCYFASGMAPVATADPTMRFERKIADMVLDARVAKQHVGESPVPADEPNLLTGDDVPKASPVIQRQGRDRRSGIRKLLEGGQRYPIVWDASVQR